MPTEMELTLEQTQQGVSYEVSVLSDIEDSHGPSDAMHNPLPATQSQKDFVSKLTEIHSFLLTFSLRNIRVNSFTMKMEILLEPTSNKLMVERVNTTAGNPVKKILLKLNLSDHRSILTDLKENLKLPTKGKVRLGEPASSAGILSSLQNLDKELSFANQFLMEKSQEDKPNKTNTESKVQSIVTIPIHQDTSSAPLMTTLIIDLTVSQPVPTAVQAPLPTLTTTATATTTTTTTTLPPIPPQPKQGSSDSILIQRIGELEQHMADMVEANQALEERLDKQGSRLYKLENLNIHHPVSKAVDEIVTDAVDWAIQAPLRDRFRDLLESNMKEIHHHRMWESNSYQAHEDYKMLTDKEEKETPPPPPPPLPSGASGASVPTGTSDSAQDPPPPPPPSTTYQCDQSHSFAAPGLSKTAASIAYTAWITTTSRLEPAASFVPKDVLMHEESDFKAYDIGSDDEDSGSKHIPKVTLNQEWFKPLSEEERPATPEPAWSIPSSSLPISNNN
ncbi:hypothetical protein Tco_0373723 [Tanacetum coccineum]